MAAATQDTETPAIELTVVMPVFNERPTLTVLDGLRAAATLLRCRVS